MKRAQLVTLLATLVGCLIPCPNDKRQLGSPFRKPAILATMRGALSHGAFESRFISAVPHGCACREIDEIAVKLRFLSLGELSELGFLGQLEVTPLRRWGE
jgi:hypothetical protein